MTLYDTVTLTVKIGANAQVFENIKASGDASGSKLLGCWYSDIGALGKVMVLRGFGITVLTHALYDVLFSLGLS